MLKQIEVLHVCTHGCPRILKLAQAQRDNGRVNPSFVCTQPVPNGPTAQFKTLDIIEQGLVDVTNYIKANQHKYDVIHCHNNTDALVPCVKVATTKPVLWGIHDLNSERHDVIELPEIAALACCDGITSTNQEMIQPLLDRSWRKVPYEFYSTYMPKSWFPYPQDKPHRGKLFLASGLRPEHWHYRYWYYSLKWLARAGYLVGCYCGYPETPEPYNDPELLVHSPTHLRVLISNLTHAEASLVGFPNPNHLAKRAQPNKLYESVSAGVPVICFDVDGDQVMSETVRKYNLGVVIKRVEEVPDALETIKKLKLRAHVKSIRDKFCMDAEEPKVMRFYQKFLH